LLADDLKGQWSCRLTAFVKPAPAMFQLQAGALVREADAFLASGRRSLARTLLGVFRRRGLTQTEEEVVGRYRAVAGQLRRAAGTRGDATLNGFMESEARAQREILLDTLHRVRIAWTACQGAWSSKPLHQTPAAFRLSNSFGSPAAGAGELCRSSSF
jgi:hypothetical protein